jgi:hypothetical protein
MVLHILEMLLDGFFGEWDAMQWAIASSIGESLVKVFGNS